jgi:predicted ATPase
MLTRIEIDGFKTFENFELNLRPFTAVVGPNASGKSNLFDAIRFISLLSQQDIRTSMMELRGEPQELFRVTPTKTFDRMRFAVEVLLNRDGKDPFGTAYSLKSQRIRYELELHLKKDDRGFPVGIFVQHETCTAIKKKDDSSDFIKALKWVKYSGGLAPFIRMKEEGGEASRNGIEIRQDGEMKRGKPVTLPANEASRTALSTVSTAEFPHLYALRELLSSTNFLEINPTAARKPSDRYESRTLKPDASNLSAVLARLQQETRSDSEPDGALADIASDLSSLITSVRGIRVNNDTEAKDYSFSLRLADDLNFSSRVISDGTLRLLALLTILNDPKRRGVLCFEEPENGVHEGRIAQLVKLLRTSTDLGSLEPKRPLFQIVINTHSPTVMHNLMDNEIVLADVVSHVVPKAGKSLKTRMRTGIVTELDGVDPTRLTRFEADRLLKQPSEGV